ncbi:MAG: DUF1015 domain-containing protein [Acidobacteria bacterium]|nr:DUF1015 domain-containing protein [Acidobacteriota bacterium]
MNAGDFSFERPVLHPAPISLIKSEFADQVIAPAYDGTTSVQRAAVIDRKPLSYLGVTRSPEDFPAAITPSTDTLIGWNREAFERLMVAEVFESAPAATMYLHRLVDGDHSQTGIVCEVDVAAYSSGDIRTHEGVRPARVALLERHLDEVRATSSPVALTFRSDDSARSAVMRLSERPADLEYTAPDGVSQQVWRLDDGAVRELSDTVRPEGLTIVDGHHRLAAAAALASRRSDPSLQRALVIVFPPEELQIFAFHRHVVDPRPEEIERLERISRIEPIAAGRPSLERGSFGLYRDGHWCLIVPLQRIEPLAPIDRLDVVALHRDLLDPAFGIDVTSAGPRISTVAGPTGRRDLEQRVDELGGIGFGLAPITMDELFEVAEAGAQMPPKSSFFWPKARSGVFLRRR